MTTIKIYDDDVLIHSLVLCKNSEGKKGWYDTVNEKFYLITEEVVVKWEKKLVESHFADLGISPLK